jgi:hypothetical protein
MVAVSASSMLAGLERLYFLILHSQVRKGYLKQVGGWLGCKNGDFICREELASLISFNYPHVPRNFAVHLSHKSLVLSSSRPSSWFRIWLYQQV